MKQDSPKQLVPKFFGNTSNSYDKVARWATLGKDDYWKKEILKQIPKGDSFLDLACGTGILTRKISEKFPNSKITGVDITEGYLKIAKKNSADYKNISYILQDAEKLKLDSKFDCIISSYISKYCDAEVLVKVCCDHLKPRGSIILHDFIYPKSKAVQKLWNGIFVVLKFLGNFVPSWKDAFLELPELIKSSDWLKSYESAMKKNGLQVRCHYLTWGTSAILVGKL